MGLADDDHPQYTTDAEVLAAIARDRIFTSENLTYDVDDLQTAVDELGATGGWCICPPTLDIPLLTIEGLTKIGIHALGGADKAGYTWATPRITRTLIHGDTAPVKDITLYGINHREIDCYPENENIDGIIVRDGQMYVTTDAGQRGLLMRAGTGYVYQVTLENLKWQLQGVGCKGIDVFENSGASGQLKVLNNEIKPKSNDTVFIEMSAGHLINYMHRGGDYVILGSPTGSRIIHMEDSGQLSFAIQQVMFEPHQPLVLVDIDNMSAENLYISGDISHNEFSLTAGKAVKICDNLSAEGDFIDGLNHGIYGHMNRIKSNPASMEMGNHNQNDRFRIDVGFISLVQPEDFLQLAIGRKRRLVEFTCMADLDGATEYVAMHGSYSANGVRNDREIFTDTPMVMSNLKCVLETAQPAGANGYTCRVRVNNIPTAITMTIQDGAKEGIDQTNAVTLAVDDEYVLEVLKVGVPNDCHISGHWYMQELIT